ncbi:MAG: TraR/DksA C4-type zinc finger protein [Acidimicrobiales bacterium]
MPKPSKTAPTSPTSPARSASASPKTRSSRSRAPAAEGAAPARRASPPKADPTAARPKATATAARPNGGAVTADRFLDEQRSLLLAEREASLRQAETLRAEAEQLAEEMEPGDTQFDEESGEGGTLNVERERDLALSAQARAAADEVDRALAKVEAGTYGTCEQCGQPIPRARLKAMPAAALCVACKSGGLSRR